MCKINMHLAPYSLLLYAVFLLQLVGALHTDEMNQLQRGMPICPFTFTFLINLNLNHQDVTLKDQLIFQDNSGVLQIFEVPPPIVSCMTN